MADAPCRDMHVGCRHAATGVDSFILHVRWPGSRGKRLRQGWPLSQVSITLGMSAQSTPSLTGIKAGLAFGRSRPFWGIIYIYIDLGETMEKTVAQTVRTFSWHVELGTL